MSEGQALHSFQVQPFQTLICGNFHGTFDHLSSLTFKSSVTLEEIKLQFTIMELRSMLTEINQEIAISDNAKKSTSRACCLLE